MENTAFGRVSLLSSSQPDHVLYWHHLKNQTNPYTEGYIGVALVSKYGKRFSGGLANNYKRCRKFYNAINKYGENKIYTSILEEGLSLCEANDLEVKYRPIPSIGWNIRQGGGNRGVLSAKTKAKISASKKGTNHLYYDKIFTPETREKIRLSKLGNKNMVGKKLSEETKRKMSLSNKGVSKKTRTSRFKKVICIDTNVVYSSQKEAEEMTGISRKQISACCNDPNRKTAGTFHWEFYRSKDEKRTSDKD